MFHVDLKFCFPLLTFKWRTSWVLLSFCLYRNVLILSSFLKVNFVGWKILSCQVFFFHHFEHLIHCLSVSIISHEKSDVNLIGTLLYKTSHFLHDAFKIFYSSLALSIFSIMYLNVNLLKFIPLGIYCVYLMCRLLFFRKFMTFSAIISLNIFFSASFLSVSISGTPIAHMLLHLKDILHFVEVLFVLLHSSFTLLLKLHNLYQLTYFRVS